MMCQGRDVRTRKGAVTEESTRRVRENNSGLTEAR